MDLALAVVWLLALSPSVRGQADEAPLKGLPSPAGPHAAAIRDLEDNRWLELGAPAPDPKWGRAPGRSWCCTMPFAPAARGAFLYGEGQHGYVKPGGRYMDDCWFYDPEWNVHLFHVAGDSRDDGKVWAYRYRRAGAR